MNKYLSMAFSQLNEPYHASLMFTQCHWVALLLGKYIQYSRGLQPLGHSPLLDLELFRTGPEKWQACAPSLAQAAGEHMCVHLPAALAEPSPLPFPPVHKTRKVAELYSNEDLVNWFFQNLCKFSYLHTYSLRRTLFFLSYYSLLFLIFPCIEK